MPLGVTYILHVASPFPLKEPKDKQEVIRPAVEGTLRVLQAASRLAIPPKRVVLTSSYVAMVYDHPHEGEIFDDNSWTILDNPAYPVKPYAESKLLAERAAW